MKKAIFLTLTMALVLGPSQTSWTAPRTSVTIAVNNNLESNISEAENVGSPIGTVLAWAFARNPKDGVWLDCDGRYLNQKDYPEFVALFGNRIPDYRGQFLRGMMAGKTLGQKVAHSMASHKHVLPEHDHEFEGATAGDGTAATNVIQSLSASPKYNWTPTSSVFEGAEYKWGQAVRKKEGVNFDMRKVVGYDFENPNAIMKQNWKERQIFENDSSFSSHSWGTVSAKATNPYMIDRLMELGLFQRTVPRGELNFETSSWTSKQLLKGWLLTPSTNSSASASSSVRINAITNQKVEGKVHSGAMDTQETGGSETAPNHTYVRYIIRVK